MSTISLFNPLRRIIYAVENISYKKSDTFFQAEDGIRDFCLSRGLGDVYKRQLVESYKFKNTEIIKIANSFDLKAWPFATHGFFRFKEQIDNLLTQLD